MTLLHRSYSIRPMVLTLGALVTMVTALSAHVVMLQVLHVPYPGDTIHAPFADWLARSLVVASWIVLWFCTTDMLVARSRWLQWLVVFLLVTGLTETFFRKPFMDAYCSNSWVGRFATNVPTLLPAAITVLLIGMAAPYIRSVPKVIATALTLGALYAWVLTPGAAMLLNAVTAQLAGILHDGWCTLPYGWNVQLPAYLTFVEPVIASFFIAALVWPSLSTHTLRRILQLALLIFVARGLLGRTILYTLYSSKPGLAALASVGQFTLESMCLALGTALTWHLAVNTGYPRNRTDSSTVSPR